MKVSQHLTGGDTVETTPEVQEWYDHSKITITYDREKIVMFVDEVDIYNLTIKRGSKMTIIFKIIGMFSRTIVLP